MVAWARWRRGGLTDSVISQAEHALTPVTPQPVPKRWHAAGRDQAGGHPTRTRTRIREHRVSNPRGFSGRARERPSPQGPRSANFRTNAKKKNTRFLGTKALLNVFHTNNHCFGIGIIARAVLPGSRQVAYTRTWVAEEATRR